ncbi:MAG: PhoH family protein [Deltaproteobacteria bacterium]|nr:PhoH family protein [Deltaproteobacteria bacterium]
MIFYVLDTNVLLFDPQAIAKFGSEYVVVPITVLEELDTFKRDQTELGRNARMVMRYLDALRSKGLISHGVELEGGGKLIVAVGFETDLRLLPDDLDSHKADNRILSVALAIQQGNLFSQFTADGPSILRTSRPDVCVVSRDVNLRIKADALGLKANDYQVGPTRNLDDLYRRLREIHVEPETIDRLYREGQIRYEPEEGEPPLAVNECVALIDRYVPSHTALARQRENGTSGLFLVKPPKESVWGVRPRNREQVFAMDLLLDDRVSLVSLVGKAGTGKTLLAIACALMRTADDHRYQKLLVSRPIFPLGRDLGYLPGDVDEKLKPWMQPIFDNVEYLLGSESEGSSGNESGGGRRRGGDYARGGHKRRRYQDLIDLGILEIEPLTYIRGRTIPHQFMIVDEAQNLTPHEIKTILTRAGEGTKVVLTGDPHQIDNPYVDSISNGLTYVIEKFRGEAVAGHMVLTHGERSELAEKSANLL